MEDSELVSVKEPLSDHHVVMQKLYAELEQEREASATAASEALSMILRLQVEKAAEKMEACQYKRMAEEKIHHAEESLAILEELLYHMEMENTSLNFQIQTYRDRLLTSSTSSPTMGEMDISRCSPPESADAFRGNMSFHGNVGRSISLPVMRFKKASSRMDIIDEDVLSPPRRQPIPEYFNDFTRNVNDKESDGSHSNMSPDMFEESPMSNCSFHCDRIANECKNMKETADTRKIKENPKSYRRLEHSDLQMPMPTASMGSENECTSCSWYSVASSNTKCDSMMEVGETKLSIEETLYSCSESEGTENFQDSDSYHSSYMESELPRNTVNCSSVHDIFEVPQGENGGQNKLQNKFLADSIPGKKDAVPSTLYSMLKGVDNFYFKDDEWIIKALQDGQCSNMLYAPRKEASLNFDWACNNCKTGIPSHQSAEELWQVQVKQHEKRLQVLEDDRRIMKQEDSDRKEQLKLLKEISEQLSMIHSQIKKPPVKKYCNKDDTSVVSFMEAMLSFSI